MGSQKDEVGLKSTKLKSTKKNTKAFKGLRVYDNNIHSKINCINIHTLVVESGVDPFF